MKPRISISWPFILNPNSLIGAGLLGILLVAYIVALYVAVIALGTFPFGETPSNSLSLANHPWYINLLTVILLVLTIVPVSSWLYQRVNDLVFAQHDNPYALAAAISQQLQTMSNPHLTLPLVVETIATTLHLPYAGVEYLYLDAHEQAAFGTLPEHTQMRFYPIRYLDHTLGRLSASDRAASRPLTDSDRIILEDIAQQVGIALYVSQLTADLRSSRERLIIAREEERRRIRNNLHDGLAPTISSFQLQLRAIRRLMLQNQAQAEQMIEELSAGLRQATAEIRQLVYDMRPPMLDELGLINTLNHMPLAEAPLQLEVIAPDPMPTLSAAMEVAIYRIATEAIHNVVKHAQATTCTVRIAIEAETLTLTIVDDGQGISAGNPNGIGTQSMVERATELGGTFAIQPAEPHGTCIEVRLPWRDENG